MAFNTVPTSLFPNYSSDGTDITLPLATISVTAGEANTTTGDSRAILRRMVDSAYNTIQALPSADRPTKMSITRSNPSVVGANTLRQTYTISFDTTYQNSALTMAPEA